MEDWQPIVTTGHKPTQWGRVPLAAEGNVPKPTLNAAKIGGKGGQYNPLPIAKPKGEARFKIQALRLRKRATWRANNATVMVFSSASSTKIYLT